jgi:hypothetical protein
MSDKKKPYAVVRPEIGDMIVKNHTPIMVGIITDVQKDNMKIEWLTKDTRPYAYSDKSTIHLSILQNPLSEWYIQGKSDAFPLRY